MKESIHIKSPGKKQKIHIKKKAEREYRLSLTLLYTGVIALVQLVDILVVSGVFLVLMRLGFVTPFHVPKGQGLYWIIVMVTSNTLACIFVVFFTKKIPLRPLNRVINSLNNLAYGKFDTRLKFGNPIKKHPTFIELTESFNTLAEELENTEVLRSDFINNFSHEFKTPIVSIAGFARLLKRGEFNEEQQKEYLSIIEEEAMHLSSMATNVMNLTKIENQNILTDVTRYNLSEQIRSCVLLLENQWCRKDIDLILEFEEYMIEGNMELLKHVWCNLLDNAIKFSDNNGEIIIRIMKRGDTLAITFTNFGIDIPKDKQEKIFNKFYQGDESHATGGHGIGLAIVKRVVSLHKGNIEVLSGGGKTTFVVTLPLSFLSV